MKFQTLNAEQNYKRMTEQPVRSLILQLATPTIISMLITSFYSMTDTTNCLKKRVIRLSRSCK